MNVAVLGVGPMSRDIAALCTQQGYTVKLYDRDATAAMDAIDVIERRLEDALDAEEIDAETRVATLDRIEATTGLEAAVADAAVVIDTGTDDVGTLQRQFADIEELVDRETLVTTGQAGLSVTAAAAGLRHPDRALGLHVHRPSSDPFVEIVVTEQTARAATDRAESFVNGLEAESVLVRDTPGLVSSRLALALEVEAMRLVSEGVASVEAIDTVLERAYDHSTGPLERADRAGLNNRLEVLEELASNLGERYQPPDILYELVDAGQTGLDAGEGFYEWSDGEPTASAFSGPALGTGDRLPDDPGHR